MSTIRQFLEKKDISWWNIMFSLVGIFFVRVALESFSSPAGARGEFFSWQGFFLHIPLSYMAIFLTLLLLIFLLTKANIKKITLFLTLAHLLIWLVPVLDLIFVGSKPNSIGYQLLNLKGLENFVFKVLLFENVAGVTLGMRVAVGLLALSVGWFVWDKTKNFGKAVLGWAFVLSTMIFYAIVPSLLVYMQTILQKNSVFSFSQSVFKSMVETSWLATTAGLTYETAYDVVMAQIFFLLVVLQLLVVVYFYQKETFLLVFHNLRPERILNYALLAFVGIIGACKLGNSGNFLNVLNWISGLVFMFLLVLNALVAIFVNDLEDISIDKLSNSERPLAQDLIKQSQWKMIGVGLFIFLAYGLFIFNERVLFFMLLTQFLFFLYSAEPFRLKKHFTSASLLIGATAASMTLAGFYLVSPETGIWAFPTKVLIAVFLSQALLSNMKDLKDYVGDKTAGIKTLPVLLGVSKAKKVIAFLYALVFLTVPFFFELHYMKIFALGASMFAYYLFTRPAFQEKYVFGLLFFYMAVLALAI